MCARVAIISDTHFGDPNCKLVANGKTTSTFDLLKDAINKKGPIDYLVLNGDTLDFSINSFSNSCAISRPFFKAIVELTKKIIYIPGNHDKQVWDATEWQRHIIRKLEKNIDPEPFVHAQAGILDLETDSINLPGVTPNPGGDYGGMYIEGLLPETSNMPIYIVYPNLFIKCKDYTTLVTHGHFLEIAWVLLSELLKNFPGGKLPDAIDVKQMEEYNLPINTMICTGLGMGGPVTGLFQTVQQQAKSQQSQQLDEAIDVIKNNIKEMFGATWLTGETYDLVIGLLKHWADSKISGYQDSRYSKTFKDKPEVQKRFAHFYAASCSQAAAFGLAVPKRVIFGHTHEAIEDPLPYELPLATGLINIELYNTGGWLRPNSAVEGTGAEVFFMDDSDCEGRPVGVNIK
jgi:Calcineurin-like phosphoesterase